MVRVRKNFYRLSFGTYVGVLVDEKLMKKIARLQFETKERLLDLLENNENHMIEHYNWTIADEPKEFDQCERTLNYITNNNFHTKLGIRIGDMFNIDKVTHLYDASHLEYPLNGETAKQEHTNYLKKEVNNG